MLQQILFDYCKNTLQTKLERLEEQKNELQKALSTESKSTAGDKHETGRAMIQLERERLGEQIQKTEQDFRRLLPLQKGIKREIVSVGSVVTTDKASYYIALSLGTFEHKGVCYYCVSAKSPIGKIVLGKKVKDQIEFNGSVHTILTLE